MDYTIKKGRTRMACKDRCIGFYQLIDIDNSFLVAFSAALFARTLITRTETYMFAENNRNDGLPGQTQRRRYYAAQQGRPILGCH